MKKKERGRADFNNYNHPLQCLKFWGVSEPYDWQREVICEAATWGSRCAVSSANGAGKTNIIIPLLGLSTMIAFPGATIVSTAGVEEQIRGQLFKYLEEKLRRYTKYGWSVSVSDLAIMASIQRE